MSAADLERVGVLYSHQPALEGVNALAAERGYRNRDEITVSPEKMGDVYEDKVRSFFHEHLHEDEEIRYIRDGHGYFDVRSQGDAWIRIHLEKVSWLPARQVLRQCCTEGGAEKAVVRVDDHTPTGARTN